MPAVFDKLLSSLGFNIVDTIWGEGNLYIGHAETSLALLAKMLEINLDLCNKMPHIFKREAIQGTQDKATGDIVVGIVAAGEVSKPHLISCAVMIGLILLHSYFDLQTMCLREKYAICMRELWRLAGKHEYAKGCALPPVLTVFDEIPLGVCNVGRKVYTCLWDVYHETWSQKSRRLARRATFPDGINEDIELTELVQVGGAMLTK